MLEEMGRELRATRKHRELSLQGVAGPAMISVAYLQKLEKGVVRDPSPRVLRRLAGALGVRYIWLMGLAGYLDPEEEQRSPASVPWVLVGQELSEAEWRAVGAFIDYLKARRDGPSPDESRTGEG